MRRPEQMAAQELQLVGHDRLVGRPVIDVEVVDARVGPQLAERCPARRGDRRTGCRHAVGLVYRRPPPVTRIATVPVS